MSDILSEAQEKLRQEDAAAAAIGADQAGSAPESERAAENPMVRLGDMLPDLSILLAKTGSGAIEDYIDHPFNTTGSRGMAQMLRGFTGIAGDLDYAVIDIVLGAINYRRESKEAHSYGTVDGTQ